VIDGNGRTDLKSGYNMVVDNTYPTTNWAPINIGSMSYISLRYLEIKGAGLDINNGETGSITSATCSGGNTVSLVIASSAHAPLVGKWVTISGVSGGSGFNGTVQFTAAPDSTHAGYSSTCSGSGTGGSIVGPFAFQEQTIRVTGGTNLYLGYSYIHDSSSDPIELVSGDTFTMEYSANSRNSSNASLHAEGLAAQQFNNVTLRYNLWEDLEGTAYFDIVNASSILTSNNWNIYGNVFVLSSGNPYYRNQLGWGVSMCQQTCTNFSFYNNTVINVGTSSNARMWGWQDLGKGGTCSNIIDENNLWYASGIVNEPVGNCSNTLRDYNTFINTTPPSSLRSNEYASTGSSPFVNWQSGDYHLISETAVAHLDDGISLSSPYNLDPDGTTRGADGTWERGAYEFTSFGKPVPPSGLAAVVQ
jgi:hypothetical protein